jgi:hypothetical protein
MSEENFIIIMLKVNSESQSEVETAPFLFHTVLIIANTVTVSLPSSPLV